MRSPETTNLAGYSGGLQEACVPYDRVLFEVIADARLAPRDADSGARRLLQSLQATPVQRVLAARHRLVAQVSLRRMALPRTPKAQCVPQLHA